MRTRMLLLCGLNRSECSVFFCMFCFVSNHRNRYMINSYFVLAHVRRRLLLVVKVKTEIDRPIICSIKLNADEHVLSMFIQIDNVGRLSVEKILHRRQNTASI